MIPKLPTLIAKMSKLIAILKAKANQIVFLVKNQINMKGNKINAIFFSLSPKHYPLKLEALHQSEKALILLT